LPEVRNALRKGTVIISRGVTCAFVAEEVVGMRIEAKAQYAMGCVCNGETTINTSPDRLAPYVIRDGKPADIVPAEAVKGFTRDDVLIKGANAVDREGNAADLVINEFGGSLGEAMPIVAGRGAHFICPVGLEKLIPSVSEAAPKCGIFRFKYATGLPCGLIPLVNARVVTEIQALEILCGVSATHVASGGIGGSEGAIVLSIEGEEEPLEKAFDLIKSIKGEPPVAAPPKILPPAAASNYDAQKMWQNFRNPPRKT
jgi:hypothetical protein